MKTPNVQTYTAFDGTSILVRGDLEKVVLNIKKHLGSSENNSVLIFSDLTGKTMDFSFHGSKQDVLKRLEKYTSVEETPESSGPGRPKLGVISREISLLPRHWEWLATQPGGASATIRLLVEEARNKASNISSVKQMQERAYNVMSVLAGDLQDYEEAIRSLYKKDQKNLLLKIRNWPSDVKKYVIEMTNLIFEGN